MRLTKVFGISSVSPVQKLETDQDMIYKEAIRMTKEVLAKYRHETFKVETKRADKTFPLKSMDFSSHLGAVLLKEIPQLKVDVHNPDFISEYTYVNTHMYILK